MWKLGSREMREEVGGGRCEEREWGGGEMRGERGGRR